jgi:hypothetical protein
MLRLLAEARNAQMSAEEEVLNTVLTTVTPVEHPVLQPTFGPLEPTSTQLATALEPQRDDMAGGSGGRSPRQKALKRSPRRKNGSAGTFSPKA